MKRIYILFFAIISNCLAVIAGGLSNWELNNFIGVWEITPSSPNDDVSWVIDCMRSPYDYNESVHSIELALDANGHGYIKYYTDSYADQIIICGTIFTSGQSRDQDEFLYILSERVEYTGFRGVKPLRIVNGNNGTARPDIDLYIRSVNLEHSAKFRQISPEYPSSQVNQIASPAIHIQYSAKGISIEDALDAEIAIYDIDGILYFETFNYKNETIAIQKGKTYIVKVNDNSMKIVY